MLFNVCFILGKPGSGKGTMCSIISKEFGFVHLSAGELLRHARDQPNSREGAMIEKHMRAGSIVPAKITCKLLLQAIEDGYRSGKCMNYLVDGFPRNDDNRSCWDKVLGPHTILKQVLLLDCSDEVSIQRCLDRTTGRTDDTLDTLKCRLQQFTREGVPVIEHYKNLGMVSTIDANMPLADVQRQVENILRSLGF